MPRPAHDRGGGLGGGGGGDCDRRGSFRPCRAGCSAAVVTRGDAAGHSRSGEALGVAVDQDGVGVREQGRVGARESVS